MAYVPTLQGVRLRYGDSSLSWTVPLWDQFLTESDQRSQTSNGAATWRIQSTAIFRRQRMPDDDRQCTKDSGQPPKPDHFLLDQPVKKSQICS